MTESWDFENVGRWKDEVEIDLEYLNDVRFDDLAHLGVLRPRLGLESQHTYPAWDLDHIIDKFLHCISLHIQHPRDSLFFSSKSESAPPLSQSTYLVLNIRIMANV